MTDINAIKEKIRKLKAMTPEQGCTEAEAATAAAAAMRLMAEHDLSDSDIEFGEVTLPTFQGRRHPADAVWVTVAGVCRCVATYRSKSVTARLSITYHGRLADVRVAEYLHQVVLGALNRASEEFRGSPMYRRRRTARTRSQALRTYLLGVATGLQHSLEAAWWTTVKSDPALRAAHKTAQAQAVAVRDRALATTPTKPLTVQKHDKGLLDRGCADGRNVTINPAATGSNDQPKMIGGAK